MWNRNLRKLTKHMPGASMEAAKVQVQPPLGSHEASPQKGAQGLSPMSYYRKTALNRTVQDRWVLWCHWAAMQADTSNLRVEKARRVVNVRAEDIDSDEDLFTSPLEPAKAQRRPERPALFPDRTQKQSAEPIAASPERNDADPEDDQLPIANATIVAPEFQARPNRAIAATQGSAEPLELRSPADGRPRCYCCSSCDFLLPAPSYILSESFQRTSLVCSRFTVAQRSCQHKPVLAGLPATRCACFTGMQVAMICSCSQGRSGGELRNGADVNSIASCRCAVSVPAVQPEPGRHPGG